MKNRRLLSILIPLTTVITSSNQLKSYGQNALKLEKEIPLQGIKGRIDHMDIDLKDQIIYLAALGNNTVEAVDLKTGKVLRSIIGLSEPQGVAYIPKHHELFVANGGTGECNFYNTTNWQKTASLKYDDDADDVRYDAGSDRIYVGYGSGGIGVIDAAMHKKVANITLPAHPESFQLDAKEGKIWINLPGSGMIGIADLKTNKLIAQWKKLFPRANFPMAYDSVQHRVMVGYRIPATLKIFDSGNGKEIFSSGMVGDVDDFYWDEATKQILISGGGGSIDIFKQTGTTAYKRVTNIKTRNGARTSLWVPELRLFLIAARTADDNPAALLVYKMDK
jgi:DNA-binding beta-propeller fold protein YncE